MSATSQAAKWTAKGPTHPALVPPDTFLYRHKWAVFAFILAALYFHIHIFLGFGLRQIFSYLIPFPAGIKDGHSLMLSMLPCMDAQFHRHNVTWFLDEGSVLGAIREQDIIKGDTDIDIGMMDFDRPKVPALIASLREHCGFTIIHRDDNLGYPSVSSFTVRRNLFRIMVGYFGPPWFIDVRDYDIDSDDIVYDADFLDDSDTFFLHKSEILPVEPCKLRHLTVPCPRNAIAVIEDEFGENWRTPIKGFKTWMIKRPSTAELRNRAVAKARAAAAGGASPVSAAGATAAGSLAAAALSRTARPAAAGSAFSSADTPDASAAAAVAAVPRISLGDLPARAAAAAGGSDRFVVTTLTRPKGAKGPRGSARP